MKTRRIGIDTAMIVTASSAMPNIFKSIVVAFILLASWNLRGVDGMLDLHRTSEMSSRLIIFRKDRMPELDDVK